LEKELIPIDPGAELAQRLQENKFWLQSFPLETSS
jgi:hypothetical protein